MISSQNNGKVTEEGMFPCTASRKVVGSNFFPLPAFPGVWLL